MELTFLGTGTSQGVPMIAFDEHDCDLDDLRNWRTRTSIHVVMGGHHIQVDASPEFRMQCLANNIRQIDTFILTHGHSDHMMGMDDLRRFCDLRRGAAMDIYSSAEGLQRVRDVFGYALTPRSPGSTYAHFALHTMPSELITPGGSIYSTRLPHGPLEVLGLLFHESISGRRLAYYTDCGSVPTAAMQLAHEVDILILDGLRHHPHPTHLTLDEAVSISQAMGARETYLIHMTHQVDQERDSAKLPRNVHISYDGLHLVF